MLILKDILFGRGQTQAQWCAPILGLNCSPGAWWACPPTPDKDFSRGYLALESSRFSLTHQCLGPLHLAPFR